MDINVSCTLCSGYNFQFARANAHMQVTCVTYSMTRTMCAHKFPLTAYTYRLSLLIQTYKHIFNPILPIHTHINSHTLITYVRHTLSHTVTHCHTLSHTYQLAHTDYVRTSHTVTHCHTHINSHTLTTYLRHTLSHTVTHCHTHINSHTLITYVRHTLSHTVTHILTRTH